ncbi:DUF2273 domain-containing protein [Bombilactobacillus mellis]|uniref:DUF2273 domain-containing protein n=1 Tax=Bombilactobacillus mellis TaxID=1218508 RepID=UPI0005F8DE93|nr:DUF2273 domain-containing protein [Bombilactobacillus mellis]
MKTLREHYNYEIVGGLIGLLMAIGFVWLGFIKTIFIVCLTIIGIVGGHYCPKLFKILQKN